jgi:pimeloyl-ACP methyl ester carboxylesterase
MKFDIGSQESGLSSEQSRNKISARIFHKAMFGMDKFILVQRYKIHYVEAGQGDPVILVPGSYNTRRTWNRLLPLLAGEFHLLALDYIGRIDSDERPEDTELTLQELTDIIAKMVRQIGLVKVSLIGGYHGGATVYDFAARYPDLVDKIISIEGSLIQSDTDPTSPQKKTPVRNTSGLPWFKIGLNRKSTISIEEESKSIKSPLLYLFGTQSDIKRIRLTENLEYLKTNLPHAWVVALDGSIHNLTAQQPTDMANIILEFLRKKL